MNVYLTVDTEITSGWYRKHGADHIATIFDKSIVGKTPDGEVGIGHKMDVMDRHGLKGVFFVDPMPALIFGVPIIRDIVQPIVDRGHDVQLHMHTEWLKFTQVGLVGGRQGNNIRDFSLEDQAELISYARNILVEAGAPAPIAFRAGNYGANDDTLRALALNGMRYDSSFCPGIARSECEIGLDRSVTEPVAHCGVIEVPIGSIQSGDGDQRHVQVTALSALEMKNAVLHAHRVGRRSFSIVSHSFELMSRKRDRVNRIVAHRFERMCADLAGMRHLGIRSGTYLHDPPELSASTSSTLLPHSHWRSFARTCEQAASNFLYGSK